MYPFIPLGNGIYLPTYLLVISLTYSGCLIWVYHRARRLNQPVSVALDFCLAIMVGGFIGARAMHVFFENWNYYRLFPLEILKIWQGGFVFYGGFFGALVASLIYAKRAQQSFWQWADFFAPVLAVGYGVGRLGCLLNGCCFGELCEFPWAIDFHQPGLPSGARHPTQIYAMLWELSVTLPLLFWLPKRVPERFKTAGQLFLTWLFLHALGRLLMESFRDDYRGPAILGLSVSTVISLVIISFAIVLNLRKSLGFGPALKVLRGPFSDEN